MAAAWVTAAAAATVAAGDNDAKGAVKKQPKEIWRVSSERLAIFFGLQWQVVENFW